MFDSSPQKVLIFGVFDMLHPGHIYFIDQAIVLGQELHINLATDEYVRQYKNKNPINSYEQRKQALEHMYNQVFVHKGDIDMGQWSVVKKINPDIIAIGYDQSLLKQALISSGLVDDAHLIDILPFHPELYSTTNLNK